MKKRISLILVLAMVLALLPTTAFATAEDNLWAGKSAVFVGDSITYGASTSKIYYQYLKESLGLGAVTAMGVSGSTISTTSDYGHSTQPLMDRYVNIPSADLIVVFMGTNDYGHETPLGAPTDTTDVSFYGALNVIVPALVATHPSSKIVFATPLHRYGFGTSKMTGTTFTYDSLPNGRGAALGDYAAAIQEVCAAHGVAVMDLYEEYPLDPADAAVRAQYMPDGLHPNADGHAIIAAIMEEHIRTYTPAPDAPEEEPKEKTELIYGNKFAAGFSQQNRASSRLNYYLKAGTKITFHHTDRMQWACAKTGSETGTNNLGYFPDSAWSDKDTATVTADGWVGFTFRYRDESQVFDLTTPLSYYITIEEPHTHISALSLRYDDHYDVSGKTVEIIDAGTPTSYQVGYGVGENAVRDAAVVALEGDTLVATGIGTAQVKIDGDIYDVTVTAAPISLLLLIGQSNMEGNEGEAKQSIVCPDGMVYATYGDRYDMVLENATHYAPSALTGAYRTINTVGGTDGLCDYPVYMLTDEGDGRKGPDSGFAYEWVKQTGEKVWIVNAAHGGTSLDVWQPGTTQYEECQAMFGACQETLRKEIAAGHFTLSHMAYFWCQGCNDYNKTAEWYVDKYLSMHESLNAEMAFDHDGDAATPAKLFELAGIIPVRAGHSWSNGYRVGTHTDSTNKSSYESFLDLQMTGPRVAQYWMCNNPELEDIVLVCNIGEDWVWMPDGTNGVSAYFDSHYPNGTVDYATQVQQSASWYKPTTPNAVHDSIHYNQIGYNEVGRESVRNALIYLGINADYEVETTVKFVDWTGYKDVDAIEAATAGSSGTLVVPIVSPVTRSKTVRYTLSEGLSYEYYDLLADSVNVEGKLCADGAVNSVAVTPRSLDSYTWNFNGTHLVSDPDEGDMDNPLSLLGGSVTDGLFNGVRYKLARNVCLNHDREWGVELKLSNWSATSGSMIFSGGSAATTGQPYMYFRPTDFFVGFGYYDGTRYHNYGVSLKNYGIACNEGSHTYCFMNRVAADGINAIWLYVDGEEIAPLTAYYVNSTLTDSNSHALSGKDFVLSYIGTSDFAVKGCVVDGIRVVETGYDPSIHLHMWSEWETKSLPSPQGPGVEQRTCATCEKTQTRAVDGVWQTYDLDEHMVTLPETYCMGTDLWSLLPHDREYYHSGVRWDVNGNVRSVTFAVSGGEHIFATAFGKRGTNGTFSSDGIRLTFFGENGVLKTTTPQETYAEFAANGGYIVVPQGAIAVNVPMYSDGDENDLYILNRPHTYDHAYDADCNACGDVRAVDVPITFGGNSVSEDVSGLAFSFDVAVEGMTVTNQTTAVYDNATVGEYRLIAMGAIASNGVAEVDINAAYLYAYSDTTASFAIRVIHIPAENYDTEITVIPYIVLLIDGVETTLYGEAQSTTVNTVLSK